MSLKVRINRYRKILLLIIFIIFCCLIFVLFPMIRKISLYNSGGIWRGYPLYPRPTLTGIGNTSNIDTSTVISKYNNFSKSQVNQGLDKQIEIVKGKQESNPWKTDKNLKFPFTNGNITINLGNSDIDNTSIDFNMLYDSLQYREKYISYINSYFYEHGFTSVTGKFPYFKSDNIYCLINDKGKTSYRVSIEGALWIDNTGENHLISVSCTFIDNTIEIQNQLFKKLTLQDLEKLYPQSLKYPQRLNIFYLDNKYALGETWRDVDYIGPGVNVLWMAVKESDKWKIIYTLCGQCGDEDGQCRNVINKYPDIPSEVYSYICNH